MQAGKHDFSDWVGLPGAENADFNVGIDVDKHLCLQSTQRLT